jgi:hypothetical protein
MLRVRQLSHLRRLTQRAARMPLQKCALISLESR